MRTVPLILLAVLSCAVFFGPDDPALGGQQLKKPIVKPESFGVSDPQVKGSLLDSEYVDLSLDAVIPVTDGDSDDKLNKISIELTTVAGYKPKKAYVKVYNLMEAALLAGAMPPHDAHESVERDESTFYWYDVACTFVADPPAANNWIVFWGVYEKDEAETEFTLVHRSPARNFNDPDVYAIKGARPPAEFTSYTRPFPSNRALVDQILGRWASR